MQQTDSDVDLMTFIRSNINDELIVHINFDFIISY